LALTQGDGLPEATLRLTTPNMIDYAQKSLLPPEFKPNLTKTKFNKQNRKNHRSELKYMHI